MCASTLPGRAEAMRVPAKHFVNGHALRAPFPEGMQLAQFGLKPVIQEISATSLTARLGLRYERSEFTVPGRSDVIPRGP